MKVAERKNKEEMRQWRAGLSPLRLPWKTRRKFLSLTGEGERHTRNCRSLVLHLQCSVLFLDSTAVLCLLYPPTPPWLFNPGRCGWSYLQPQVSLESSGSVFFASSDPAVAAPSASHFPGEPQPGSDSVFSELNQIPPSTLLELTSDLKEMCWQWACFWNDIRIQKPARVGFGSHFFVHKEWNLCRVTWPHFLLKAHPNQESYFCMGGGRSVTSLPCDPIPSGEWLPLP